MSNDENAAWIKFCAAFFVYCQLYIVKIIANSVVHFA